MKNRLVKAALTERISNVRLEPTRRHEQLYSRWAQTGAGILITGNILVDRNHLESSGNVCFDDITKISDNIKWVEAGISGNNHLWAQLSHAGRQTNRFCNNRPLAPSAVQLQKMGLFGKPKAMTEVDILQVIKAFVTAAHIAKESGFTGVQIHAAHGYLLSQFLSPLTNRRTDQWGGNPENRRRLLIQIIKEVRKIVGSAFPISVKLNSSDFQRGGFSEEESLSVVNVLANEGVDLLEISGGTYEKLAFFLMNDQEDQVIRPSTQAREAYFIDFAKQIRNQCGIPLMVTGGFRTRSFCNQVIAHGELDFIGMGRPFITDVDIISSFISGDIELVENRVIRTGLRQLEDAAEGGYYARQIIRLAKGANTKTKMNPLISALYLTTYELIKSLQRTK